MVSCFHLQGDAFKVKLTIKTLRYITKTSWLCAENVKEGHRTYSAFHPKDFMQQELFDNAANLWSI
jgi:hypothetical protein